MGVLNFLSQSPKFLFFGSLSIWVWVFGSFGSHPPQNTSFRRKNLREEEMKLSNDERKEELKEEEDKNSLWEKCSILFINSSDGNEKSLKELEEISQNNPEDIICIGYYLLLIDHPVHQINQLKRVEITNQITGKIKSMGINFEMTSNLTNKHQQLIYGTLLEFGITGNKNPEESLRLLQLSADQGFLIAEYVLGLFYSKYSRYNHKNLSVQYLLRSAEKGFAMSQLAIGGCYLFGKGVQVNEEEGLKWCKRGIDQGLYFGLYFLGNYFLKCQDQSKYEEGCEMVRKSAEYGYSQAQYDIGMMYFLGNKVIQMNEEEAMKWIQLSVDNGNSEGLDMIGQFYYYGRMLRKDTKQSIQYLESSNSSKAQYQLGFYYLQVKDESSTQNQKKGFEYFTKVNNHETVYAIGLCYEYGLEVKINADSAFSNFHNYNYQTYPLIQYALGRCYEEGIGIEVNVREAKRYFQLSAENGNIDAQNRLKEFEEDKLVIKMKNNGKYEFIKNK